MNSEYTDNESWTSFLQSSFGTLLAAKAVSAKTVIPARFVSEIEEASIPGDARAIYRELKSISLTANNWAHILSAILKCKFTVPTKIPLVYKAVFETLTGKEFDASVYYKLPEEEKVLWESKYVQNAEDYRDKQTYEAHKRVCKEQIIWLIEFCDQNCINIPGLEIDDIYLDDPEINQISIELQKQTETIKQEIKATEAQLKAQEDLEISKLSEIQRLGNKEILDQKYQGPASNSVKSQTVQSEAKVKKGVGQGIVNTNVTVNPPFNPDYQTDIGTIRNFDRDQRVLHDYQSVNNPCTVRFKTTHQPTASSPKHILQQSTVEIGQTKCNKSMADERVKLRDFFPSKYDGRSLLIEADSHLLSFTDYLSGQKGVTNLDDTVLTEKDIDMFKYSLEGDARLWYEANAPFGSLKDLEISFLKEFSPEMKSDTTAAKAFAELTYNPRTKLTAFVNKIMRLNRTLNYQDNVLRDRFMSAMPVEVRRLARIAGPKTFRESVQEVKRVLEDTPDEVVTTKNAVAMVGDDHNDMNEMSLAMHTMRRQIDNLNRRLGDSPVNYYSENDNVNVRPHTDTDFQSFQNPGGPFGEPRNSGNFYQDRSRYNQGQYPQQWYGPPAFTQSRGQGQRQGNGGRSYMTRGVCNFCFKRGHYARECWFKWDRDNNQSDGGNFQINSGNNQPRRGNYQANRGNYQAYRGNYQSRPNGDNNQQRSNQQQ